MIVEDNKEMNDYLASIFGEKYDIIRAYNGAEACKKIARQLPNLIISDLMMPVMDGLEFTERVKQDVTTSHIPVILLTAKTDENDHTEGYLRGADAYITKPFNAKNLELLVQNIQKSRKQNIEHFKQAEELNIKQITNNPRDEVFMKELVELIMANLTKEDFGRDDDSLDGNPVVGEAGSFEDIDRCGGPAAVAVDDGGSHLSFDTQFEQRTFVAGKVLVDGLRTR